MARAKKAAAPKPPPPPDFVDLSAFGSFIRRKDADHGHLYQTPDGDFWGATTFIGAIDKPALKYWYANQQAAFVIEAAAQLWETAPRKMDALGFKLAVKERIKGVKAAQKELEKAQEIGTQAHALVEWELRRELGQDQGPRPETRPEALWAFESWETWRRSVELEPLWVEQVVYSKRYGYAGTVDLIARLHLKDARHDYGRVLTMIDWKTGKRHYAESSLQAAAYSEALHEMGHSDGYAPPGLVIRLPKVKSDPGFDPKVVHLADHEKDLGAFLHAKAIWEWVNQEEAELAARPVPESLEDQLARSIAEAQAGEPIEAPF